MDYTYLGRTGLQVSRLCLGTMNFGPYTSEADSFAIMDKALDLGLNFFDTANIYGGQPGGGLTESILGRWLAQGDGRREKIVLATKVYHNMSKWPNDSRLSARHIRQACEDSLQRLQTDHLDLYQMHHVDRNTPWEEIWQALDQLVREGKIIYTGSSNFAAWHITQANAIAERRHSLGLVSEQSIYHLNNRMIELEVIPACKAQGLAVLPWSPLSGGLLAGILAKQEGTRRNKEGVQKQIDELRPQLEAWEGLCKELEEHPADVAIAWQLHQEGITAPIIGPRTMEQLNNAMHAMEIKLSEDTLKKIDSIWPGPGGHGLGTPSNTAPEAYAW